MVIVWGVVAVLGGLVTVVAAWGTSPLLALLLAPFGGSACVAIGALLLCSHKARGVPGRGRNRVMVHPGA